MTIGVKLRGVNDAVFHIKHSHNRKNYYDMLLYFCLIMTRELIYQSNDFEKRRKSSKENIRLLE